MKKAVSTDTEKTRSEELQNMLDTLKKDSSKTQTIESEVK